MSDLMDQLTRHLSGDALESLSHALGADRSKTQSALATALPVLLGARARNASEPEGAEALHDAIMRDHDGSILDDAARAVSAPNLSDGEGILKHVLGDRQTQVQRGLSRASGLGKEQAARMLATLAPLVLGALGRANRGGGTGAGALSEMLQGEGRSIEARAPGMWSVLSGLLDSGQNGNGLEDLAGGAVDRLSSIGKLFGGRA